MERQPTRSKRVREDRQFDRTQLRIAGHGRTVHRDYAAHYFRWNFVAQEADKMQVEKYADEIFFRYGWVQRQIKQGLRILDVGCGQDQPLLYVLAARMQTVPELYVGVDLNGIAKKSNCRWAKIHDRFDFIASHDWLLKTYGEFDVIVNFEVIEHMSTEDGAKLLEGCRKLLKPDTGVLYLSTPVFNGMAAANHIHEYTIPELKAAIEAAGMTVTNRFGTFASKPDLYYKLPADQQKTWDLLETWYGNEVMSCFLAPLYPDLARNNLWTCKRKE